MRAADEKHGEAFEISLVDCVSLVMTARAKAQASVVKVRALARIAAFITVPFGCNSAWRLSLLTANVAAAFADLAVGLTVGLSELFHTESVTDFVSLSRRLGLMKSLQIMVVMELHAAR